MDKKVDSEGYSKIKEFLNAIISLYKSDATIIKNNATAIKLLNALWLVGYDIMAVNAPYSSAGQLISILDKVFHTIGAETTVSFLSEKLNETKQTLSLLSINCLALHLVCVLGGKPNRGLLIGSEFITSSASQNLIEKIKNPLKQVFETGDVGRFGDVRPAEFLADHIWDTEKTKALFHKAYEKSDDYVIKTIKSRLDTSGSCYEFEANKRPDIFNYPLLAELARGFDFDVLDPDSKEALTVFIKGVEDQEKASLN